MKELKEELINEILEIYIDELSSLNIKTESGGIANPEVIENPERLAKRIVNLFLKDYNYLIKEPIKQKGIEDPIKEGYYLTKTIENKFGICYWDGLKFWDDPKQNKKLSFGIKREWIKDWYNLPI